MTAVHSDRQRRPTTPTVGSPADDSPDASPDQVARTIVLNTLNRAPKTRSQLAELLASRGVPTDVAEGVLDRFEELRLINDEQYAYDWVMARHEHRRLSKRALAMELRRKGVADDHIDAAIEHIDAESEHSAARDVAERKARSTQGLAAPVRHRRMMAAVMRKGYSASIAAAAVREVLGECSDDDT